MIYTLNSSEVRKNFSQFIDTVIRKRPQIIKRSRDRLIAVDIQTMSQILNGVKMHYNIFAEEDGSYTASLEEIDIVVNGNDEEEIKKMLAKELFDYAIEYYDDFDLYSKAPNRKNHIAYILKILIANEIDEVEKMLCLAGEN